MDYKDYIFEMFKNRQYSDITYVSEDVIKCKEGDKIIYTFLTIDNNKFVMDRLKEIRCIINDNKLKHVIIIYNELTPKVKSTINNMNIIVELFSIKSFMYSPVNHYLVPKHELCSNQVRIDILSKFGENIPKMLQDDTIARYYRFEKGDIVKITRKNNLISYRIVI